MSVPLPQTAAGPTRTHCPYCGFQCGILLEVGPGGRGTVTGDPDFPVNNGQLCIKGHTSGELLGHPARLTRPRVRAAGGAWRDATWDAALDELAGRIDRIRTAHGPEALAAFGSGALTNEKAYLLGKFARLALRTPHIDYNGRYCMASSGAAAGKAFGIDRGLPFPVADIAAAQVVMVVGSNLADTHPPMMQYFEAMKAAGGKLIVADPRQSATARAADLHLPVTPGSDAALANGLLFVAVQEKLIDRAYIAERTVGFDTACSSAMAYYPVRVERLTGISESALRKTARMLARAERSLVLTARGAEQHARGVENVLAFINLMLSLGKVGKPSSGYGTLTGQGNGQGGREHGQKSEQLPGYRHSDVPEERAAVAAVWGVDPDTLPGRGMTAVEILRSVGTPGGVRGLLVFGSNLAVCSPDAGHAADALAALDCLAVCDAFPNETSENAHFLLPTTQWAEEDGTVTNMEGRVIRRRRAVEPPDGARSDIAVMLGLADRLGVGDKFRFAGPRDVFDELRRASAGGVADYAGITYDRLDAVPGLHWPCPAEDHPGTPRLFAERFFHPDGKAQFHPVEYAPPPEEPDDEYPLWFTTGRYKEQYNSGAQTRRVGPLAQAQPQAKLLVHPHTARRLGLPAQGRVVVESRRGRAEFVIAVDLGVRPDTVFAPFHYGGMQAANRVTLPALDPVSRMPSFKACAVRVRPAPGGAS